MSLSRKDREDRAFVVRALMSVGFTEAEAASLRRIAAALHRWDELECGNDRGGIDRGDGGVPMWYDSRTGSRTPIRDGEALALARLARVVKARNDRVCGSPSAGPRDPMIVVPGSAPVGHVAAYHQSDPRGCSLYILRPGDVPAGADANAHYNRGIAVY